MSMNLPPEQQQQQASVPVDATQMPVDQQAATAPMDTSTIPVDSSAAPVDNTQTQAAPSPEQEAQVVEAVAEDLAEDIITAEDIMLAMISQTFGVSAQAAGALFNIFMQDMQQQQTEPPASNEQQQQ